MLTIWADLRDSTVWTHDAILTLPPATFDAKGDTRSKAFRSPPGMLQIWTLMRHSDVEHSQMRNFLETFRTVVADLIPPVSQHSSEYPWQERHPWAFQSPINFAKIPHTSLKYTKTPPATLDSRRIVTISESVPIRRVGTTGKLLTDL